MWEVVKELLPPRKVGTEDDIEANDGSLCHVAEMSEITPPGAQLQAFMELWARTDHISGGACGR
jgi:hypothetical protein